MVKSFDSVQAMLDRFNFERVRAIFVLNGWSYFDGVPTVERLRETAKAVCDSAIKSATSEKVGVAESGRFLAIYFADGELELNFIAESETAYV